jgi:hypothetical protein
MDMNKLVFGGLALGCMAAAAGGGYLAARQSAPPAEAAFSAPAPLAADATGAPAKPVTESEGVIAPDAGATTAAPAGAPAATTPTPVAPRREAAPRSNQGVSPRRSADRSVPAASPARDTERHSPQADRTAAVSAPTSPAPAPTNGGMWETRPTVTPDPASSSLEAREPEPPPPPPAPEYFDLVVPADAVLGLQIERTISSESARVEDRVEARVSRDVRVGDRVAIPAGSIVQGSVSEVERGGKVKERARLAIRFHTVVLDNGTRLNIKTDSVVREGASPSKESAAKIGGAAIGGAILGAILGGGKGAVIGGATGAAGGTAATMAGDRNPAVLTQGTTVSVRMQQPVTVTVEK